MNAQQRSLHRRIAKAVGSVQHHDHILRVSLFGSRAVGTARADSDIDLLIEFRTPVSLFELAHMEDELERELGARVDLLTPASISPHLRVEVLRTAIPVYGA